MTWRRFARAMCGKAERPCFRKVSAWPSKARPVWRRLCAWPIPIRNRAENRRGLAYVCESARTNVPVSFAFSVFGWAPRHAAARGRLAMKLQFQAKDRSGQALTGQLEAASLADGRELLRRQGLFLLSVAPADA